MIIEKESLLKERLYCISYLFAFLYSFLPMTMVYDVLIPSGIGKFLLVAASLTMLSKVIMFDSFELKEFIFYVIIFIPIAINALIIDRYDILLLAILFVGSRNMDSKLILKLSLSILSVCLVVVILLSLINIIPNIKSQRLNQPNLRYSLGTIFPTVFGSFVLFFSLQYFYWREKVKVHDIVFITILAIVTHYLTDNRLVTLLMILLILIETALMKDSVNEKITDYLDNELTKKVWRIIYFLPMLTMILLATTYRGSGFHILMDRILSGRVSLSYRGFSEFGMKLLGQDLPLNGLGGLDFAQIEAYFYLDSLPIALLIRNGIIIFLLYIVYNYKSIAVLFKEKNYRLLFLLTIIIFYDSIDDKSLKIAFNPFPLVMATYFYPQVSDESKRISKNTVIDYMRMRFSKTS